MGHSTISLSELVIVHREWEFEAGVGAQADNREGERTQGLTLNIDPSALVPAIGIT